MNVLISTTINVEGTGIVRGGTFPIRDSDFKKDADWFVAIRAYEWIQEQRREHGFRDIEIVKVTWNADHDITDIVKQVRPVIQEDDLPF